MSKDGDMSLFNDVLQPFRRIINTDPPKDKLNSKLNLSDSNQSIKEESTSEFLTPGIKRKLSINSDETPKKIRRESEPPQMSPWERNRIKHELIAAKTEITKMQLILDKQNDMRKEMEILFDSEREVLNTQHKNDEKALASMQEHLNEIRRREADVKNDLEQSKKVIEENKRQWSKEKSQLQDEISDLTTKLQEVTSSSQGQIIEMKRDMDELMTALDGAQTELELVKKDLEKQTANAENYLTLKSQYDKQSAVMEDLKQKLQVLECEKRHWNNNKTAKATEERLSKLEELEKEVVRLREAEKSLRDMVRNKMLLEEQVRCLSTRLDTLKPVQQELQDAKMKIVDLERSLEQWISVGNTRGVTCAKTFAAILDQELHKEVTAVSDCAQAQSKLAQVTEEMATAKYEMQKATAKLNDLQKGYKTQENMIRKLQKRVILVTRERDCYREQLDCYERDLTVTGDVMAGGGSSARVQQLEKTVQGYRDLLAKYDSEENNKVVESLQSELSKWREEAESLRKDSTTLRAQRDNLQAHLERLATNTKVLHLTDNPAALAQKEVQNELQAAQEEIKRLKTALKEGAQGCPDEIAQLKQQVERNKIKAQRMKEEFVSSALEYRDVCYLLLGYKIDRTGPKNYRLSSMFSESPSEEYLMFTLRDGDIELVQTDYSDSLEDLVDLHLRQHNSLPLFLSSLTIDLFTKSTVIEADSD